MRRAVLILTDRFLTGMLNVFGPLQEGFSYKIIKNPLPRDVKIVRMGHDVQGNAYILLESEEFEDIIGGCSYPTLESPIIQQTKLVEEVV